jgi:hypothetical protein
VKARTKSAALREGGAFFQLAFPKAGVELLIHAIFQRAIRIEKKQLSLRR